MKCKRVQKVLVDYVDDSLSSEDNRLVREHIAECENCRRELDTLERVLKFTDNAKVEYPQESVWENFLPDLHRRIENEAALTFKKQQQQRLYLLPGWIASAAVIVLILFASAMLRYYPPTSPIQFQQARNIEMVESSFSTMVESSSEPVLVAGIISRVLITEEEAMKLKKLKNFIQSETLALSYDYDYDYLADTNDEESSADDEEIIQFLLESEFAEFGESPIMESDDIDFGMM